MYIAVCAQGGYACTTTSVCSMNIITISITVCDLFYSAACEHSGCVGAGRANTEGVVDTKSEGVQRLRGQLVGVSSRLTNGTQCISVSVKELY